MSMALLADATFETLSAKLDCASGFRPFNPRTMKRKYRVGVHANRGDERAFKVCFLDIGQTRCHRGYPA
jgi:hypothetical protein